MVGAMLAPAGDRPAAGLGLINNLTSRSGLRPRLLAVRAWQLEAEGVHGRQTVGTIARLRWLRGIDTVSALGLYADVGELERFEHPDSVDAYVGIVGLDRSLRERNLADPSPA
jgi:hypothetical protein